MGDIKYANVICSKCGTIVTTGYHCPNCGSFHLVVAPIETKDEDIKNVKEGE